MSAPKLAIIIGSTRPGRIGLPVAEWFASVAKEHGGFDVELVDLVDVGLPLYDEPNHPIMGQYVHDHTKRWAKIVGEADAFVFVIPEYNHGFNAATKNAVDFLYNEWQHKAMGFVSYGGVSAGTRAVSMLKSVVVPLKVVPMVEAVTIPFVQQFLVDGKIEPNEVMTQAADAMLNELARWTPALISLRAAK